MLVIKNLVKKYHNNTILNNLSYEFEKGNLYIIRGDNGSGKSTLLKILSKISYKTSGEISGNERIAYLHDKPVFPYLMRVDDYLKTVIKLNNSNVNYLDILEEYNIPNKRIFELSKGNKAKLGIAQVLLNDMDIYIFDEPIDGLDDFAKELFKNKILELIFNDKIVIMSLHEMNIFENDYYKLITLKDGRLYD